MNARTIAAILVVLVTHITVHSMTTLSKYKAIEGLKNLPNSVHKSGDERIEQPVIIKKKPPVKKATIVLNGNGLISLHRLTDYQQETAIQFFGTDAQTSPCVRATITSDQCDIDTWQGLSNAIRLYVPVSIIGEKDDSATITTKNGYELTFAPNSEGCTTQQAISYLHKIDAEMHATQHEKHDEKVTT